MLQNPQERLPVHGITAKLTIHDRAYVVECTQSSSRQALDTDCGLVQLESLENRVGMAMVHIVAGNFNESRFFKKTCIQRLQIRCVVSKIGFQAIFNVEQQDLVKLGDRFGSPIVFTHQLFAGTLGQSAVRGLFCAKAK